MNLICFDHNVTFSPLYLFPGINNCLFWFYCFVIKVLVTNSSQNLSIEPWSFFQYIWKPQIILDWFYFLNFPAIEGILLAAFHNCYCETSITLGVPFSSGIPVMISIAFFKCSILLFYWAFLTVFLQVGHTFYISYL